VCFENKNISFYFEKLLYIAYYNAVAAAVNEKVVGLTPGWRPAEKKLALFQHASSSNQISMVFTKCKW
jgi:hypothetical protein